MSDVKDQMVRVGVIGLGFMGATHLDAYQRASDAGVACVVVAVCDRKAHRRAGQIDDTGGNFGESPVRFDPLAVRAYTDPADLLAATDIDLVSICTPTDSHVDLAIAALNAGKHVLVEKPVALRSADVRRVEAAARDSQKLCMPAMCMRFWPAWSWLRQRIDEQTFGPCRGLTLTRIGSAPQWSTGFYSNPSRSGGAVVDLHIHDADFVRWCFGDPPAVTSTGAVVEGGINHVTTIYHFDHSVVAEGGWLAPGTPFRMRYLAAFVDAVADFDLDEIRNFCYITQVKVKRCIFHR
jgi:predicted dehydrogenase